MMLDVYFNLHTGLWSMKDRKTGRVTGHTAVIASPQPVSLVVQPAGHRKVIETQQKNVHAFVRGGWLDPHEDVTHWQALAKMWELIPVSYNPYRAPSFYRKDTGEDIAEAKSIVMIAAPDSVPYVGAIL